MYPLISLTYTGNSLLLLAVGADTAYSNIISKIPAKTLSTYIPFYISLIMVLSSRQLLTVSYCALCVSGRRAASLKPNLMSGLIG